MVVVLNYSVVYCGLDGIGFIGCFGMEFFDGYCNRYGDGCVSGGSLFDVGFLNF